MTQKIIAFVDGSAYSASVCAHAAWIATRSGAPVELLHVLDRSASAEKQDLSGAIQLGARSTLLSHLADLDAERSKLLAEHGRAILDDGRAIVEQAGVTNVTTRLRQGDIVEAVADIETEARVILIGKRGEAADFAKGHLGSNMERIVRATKRPVLVASRAFRPILKVLVAWDGGASVRRAVDHLAGSEVFQGLAIHVVTVARDTSDARASLAEAEAVLSGAGIKTTTAIIDGQPETALSKLVETDGFDMLVMGAYGHSRIRNLIIGSTSSEMVRSCKVPVVLLR
ncbi:universal stress protein [Paracoccus sp. SCSIO 75233]|uniref:universal stress protein n=1 Tax=Paracoccus sp. SCSIO 75233 TaxID=3017782 RepID=UPI0022F062FD|nr:universal stress protein [Paracoccus sp. SCSIO 75233]WBU53796.1 universal stress protein [Paracoccus sp. SCSIO 75233]